MATDLSVDGTVALVIAGMALATYLTRTAGYWIMGHVPLTARVRRVLEALPGAVVMATVVPLTVKAGLSALVAMAVVVAAMLTLKREFPAVAIALAAAALARQVGL